MISKRRTQTPRPGSPGLAKHRQLIAAALLRAISVQGATNAKAAKWLGISSRTLFAWVHCERPVTVEIVLACTRLGDEFRRALCVHEHEPLPYVARKRSR